LIRSGFSGNGRGVALTMDIFPSVCAPASTTFALLEIKTLLFHLLGPVGTLQLGTLREDAKIPLKFAKDGFDIKTVGGFWLNMSPRKSIHHSIMKNVANEIRKSCKRLLKTTIA